MEIGNLRTEQEIIQNWRGETTKPAVSIACITYNHEKYIEDAIKGFLIQETDFPFEVLIHDDASTDRTADIIREYEAKYPRLIKPLYQIENQYSKGVRPNPCFNFPRAQGKYIALCEGDDYWTDPKKLQIQYDFLENHAEYVCCYHNAFVFYGTKIVEESKLPINFKRDFSSIEMMKSDCFILTLSCFFRNCITEFPKEICLVKNGDNFLFSLLGQHGGGKFLKQIRPSAYRVHKGGIWSTKSITEKRITWATTYFWLAQYYKQVDAYDFLSAHYLTKAIDVLMKEASTLEKAAIITRLIKSFIRSTIEKLFHLGQTHSSNLTI